MAAYSHHSKAATKLSWVMVPTQRHRAETVRALRQVGWELSTVSHLKEKKQNKTKAKETFLLRTCCTHMTPVQY